MTAREAWHPYQRECGFLSQAKVEGIEQGTGAAAEAAAEAEEEAGAKDGEINQAFRSPSAKGEGEEGDMDVNAVHTVTPVASGSASISAPSRGPSPLSSMRNYSVPTEGALSSKSKEQQRKIKKNNS